jgi:aminomethyltransferase
LGLLLKGNESANQGDCIHHKRVQIGVVTSAMSSPLIGRNIALCRLDISCSEPRFLGAE